LNVCNHRKERRREPSWLNVAEAVTTVAVMRAAEASVARRSTAASAAPAAPATAKSMSAASVSTASPSEKSPSEEAAHEDMLTGSVLKVWGTLWTLVQNQFQITREIHSENKVLLW
jgi:hypothetical protein